MINGKELLIKKFGRRIVERRISNKLAHVCEACSTGCLEDHPSSDCSFRVIDKESMIKKLFIYSNIHISREDNEEIRALFDIGLYRHGITLYDLYLMDISYNVCKACNGSGITVGHDSINECKECNGTGLIKKEHTDEVLVEFHETEFGFSHCTYYADGTDAIIANAMLTYNSNKKIYDHYIHKVSYINKKYIGYVDEHYPVLDTKRRYVVFDKLANRVELSGTYFEIHDKTDIPYYMDIEYLSNGKYKVCSEEEFWKSHVIVASGSNIILPENVYDKMRSEIITTGLLLYTRNATYDCTELVEKYTNKYTTVDMIVDNVTHHIDEMGCPYVTVNMLTYVNKIIADGNLIGMHLTQSQAAKIMESIIFMVGEKIYPILLSNNAIIIFIVEVICVLE